MATYPIEMPAYAMKQQIFNPQTVDYVSPTGAGRVDAVSAGNALWAAQWTIDDLDEADGDAMAAFLDRMRGAQRSFLGRDQKRLYPKAYPAGFAGLTRAGGGAFDGSATSWSQTIDSEGDATIQLTGLPAAMPLSIGDYIGWKWDASGAPAGSYQRRALCRVIAAASANGSGTINALVEPPLATLVVPVGAIAHLDRPACVMKIISGQTQIGSVGAGNALKGGTIAAIQDLRT